MSMSVRDSLLLESAVLGSTNPKFKALYLRNTTATQTTVKINSTDIREESYTPSIDGNYILDPATVIAGESATCRLGASKIGTPAAMQLAPISRLVYNYLTNAIHTSTGVTYPTYDQLQMTVDPIAGTIQYTLQVDPLLVDTDSLVYPVFLQVPSEAMRALRNDATGVTPPSTVYGDQRYLLIWINNKSYSVDKDNWQDYFIQTPDQQWWFVASTEPHTNPKELDTDTCNLLFNPDGHTENNPYYATLNSFHLVKNPAAWNECAGATVDLAFKIDTDTEITITVDEVVYTFNNIVDLRARAAAVLPKDVLVEFLSKNDIAP